ncbi:MAG: hypothetical protein JJU32_17790 [Phormidium sp. BM_Day4_Bin.17]|nr:hypothetical protein [Phormidium sp. BM_Day4_Bin.17]UCJ11025.1 MAG: hypothetical protein JWS08_14560 [Phormidium sp. PBR-2020]
MVNHSKRSVNIGGNSEGVINLGDGSIIENRLSDSPEQDVANLIEDILGDLKERYANASEAQKQTVFQMEIERAVSQNPKLRRQLLNSIKAGGFELTKVLTNNPFVAVPMEMFKAWLETE